MTTARLRATTKRLKKAERNTKDKPEARYELINLQKARERENKNENELTFNQDRNPFVLVLVDGDGYLVRLSYFPRYPLSSLTQLFSSKSISSSMEVRVASMQPAS